MSSILGSLLTEQGKSESGIPQMLFTDNADLRNTIRRAVGQTDTTEVETDGIIAAVEEYTNLESGEGELEIFDRIANAFAGKLKEGIEALKGVHATVTDLADKINEHAAVRIAQDSTLSKVFNIERDVQLDHINWDLLNIIDEYSLREIAHNSVNLPVDRETTPSLVDLVINKMPCANEYNTIEIGTINLNEEKMTKIIDSVHAALPEESREFVGGVVRNIFSLDTTSAQRAVAAAKQFAAGKTASNINHIMKVVAGYYKVLSVMDAETLDLAQSTMEELNKHINTFNAIANTMAYICFYYRNNVWKDSVIVPGPLCNADNLEKFTEQGGTEKQLVQHHTKFYKDHDLSVPKSGISSEFVLKTAKDIEDQFATEAAKNAAKINQKKADIDRSAFIVISTNYLNANRDKFSPSFHQQNLSQYAASIHDSTPGQPVEAKLYKMLLGSQHIGTIVPKLYDRLNSAYVEYTSKVGSLDEAACEELDIAVYSDMISEHLVDQGILIV